MTKAGSVAASLVAASTVAFASASAGLERYSVDSLSSSGDGSGSSRRKKEGDGSAARTSAKDKFAPRFDGLRFIETLVTAHR